MGNVFGSHQSTRINRDLSYRGNPNNRANHEHTPKFWQRKNFKIFFLVCAAIIFFVAIYVASLEVRIKAPVLLMTTHNRSNIVAYNSNNGQLITASVLNLNVPFIRKLSQKNHIQWRSMTFVNTSHFVVVNGQKSDAFIAMFECSTETGWQLLSITGNATLGMTHPYGVAYHPTKEWLFVTTQNTNALFVFDINNMDEPLSLPGMTSHFPGSIFAYIPIPIKNTNTNTNTNTHNIAEAQSTVASAATATATATEADTKAKSSKSAKSAAKAKADRAAKTTATNANYTFVIDTYLTDVTPFQDESKAQRKQDIEIGSNARFGLRGLALDPALNLIFVASQLSHKVLVLDIDRDFKNVYNISLPSASASASNTKPIYNLESNTNYNPAVHPSTPIAVVVGYPFFRNFVFISDRYYGIYAYRVTKESASFLWRGQTSSAINVPHPTGMAVGRDALFVLSQKKNAIYVYNPLNGNYELRLTHFYENDPSNIAGKRHFANVESPWQRRREAGEALLFIPEGHTCAVD